MSLINPKAPLPTFLIIGAQKSATRWLRYNLGLHPDIFTPDFEVSFFNHRKRFRKGSRWYQRQFRGWDGEPIVGEATPGYMIPRHNPKLVAERIRQTVPEARLIAVLRNPIDRSESALLHHIRRERVPPDSSVLDLIRAEGDTSEWLGLISAGRYAECLRPFHNAFGDQLLVMLHDDVQSDPRAVYRRALEHVGADPDFVPAELDDVLYSNRTPERARDTGIDARDQLTTDERRRIFEFFRYDVRQLERMIDRDLSAWDPDDGAGEWPAPQVGSWYREAADWIASLIRGIDQEQLDTPALAGEGSVRTMVLELARRAHRFAAMLRSEPLPDALGGADDSPAVLEATFRSAADDLLDAVSDPKDLSGEVSTPFGTTKAPVMAGVAFVNQLLGGWDLARTTGQSAEIPADLIQPAFSFARRHMAPGRRPGDRAEIEIGDDASPSEQFVAYMGLDPRPSSAASP